MRKRNLTVIATLAAVGAAVAVVLVGTAGAAGAATALAGAAPAQTINVDLADQTGPVMHGATGALYGLSEDNVPGQDLLSPLNITTLAQGPPAGLQHPTGHSDDVAPEFTALDGKFLLVYVQDHFTQFPYEKVGIPNYLPVVDQVVADSEKTDAAGKTVFVPFNEPDNIWYSLQPSRSDFNAQMTQFEQDWSTVYEEIKADDPHALIAGPNTSVYNSTVMADFLAYAKAQNQLPDLITWHVLEPSAEQAFPADFANFKMLEQQDGINLPVDIDEYADRYDESVPGEMVQYLSLLENAKVFGDLAFWDIANNFSDTAVQNDEPNGQWWLYDWYAGMTGDTVQVTPPSTTIDTLSGLASLDTGKRQARVIVGDPGAGNDTVAINGIDRSTFGTNVHVSVQKIGWTGYDGSAYTPIDVAETNAHVINGSIQVPVGTTDPMTAYQIIVTPATGAHIAAPSVPDTQTYQAEDATLTDAGIFSQGSQQNFNGYATSGGMDVGSIDEPDSSVAFHVTAPQTGRYLLSIFYGNQTEDTSTQFMSIDGGPATTIDYPATLTWLFRSHKDVFVNLTAGSHTIKFSVSDPTLGLAQGQVTMDDIQLTYAPGEVPGLTEPASRYPAAYAQLSGDESTVPCAQGCGATQAASLHRGGSATFAVDAASDGYYELALSASSAGGGVDLSVDETDLGQVRPVSGLTAQSSAVVFLHAGINPIRVTANRGTANVRALAVGPDARADAASATTYAAAAPQNILSGTAVTQPSPGALNGVDVGFIGDGVGNTLTITGVHAPTAGTYRVMVSYADDDRVANVSSNVNLIDRAFTIATSGGTDETVFARNTYSWNQFDTIETTVQLNAGENTITFGNPTAFAPNIDKIIVAKAVEP